MYKGTRLYFVLCVGLSFVPVAAHADTVTESCGSVTFKGGNGGSNGENVSCPGFTTAALSLNSVSLGETASFSGAAAGSGGPFESNVFFAPEGPSGVKWSPDLAILNNGTTSGGQTATSGVTLADFLSGFQVNINYVVQSGSADSTTGTVSVTYNFTPGSAVPEPATMPMLFGALLVMVITTIRAGRRRA